jgi:hypothetical protein
MTKEDIDDPMAFRRGIYGRIRGEGRGIKAAVRQSDEECILKLRSDAPFRFRIRSSLSAMQAVSPFRLCSCNVRPLVSP